MILVPIVFLQVPLTSSSADLPFRGNLTIIGAATRPHAPPENSAQELTRSTHLHAIHKFCGSVFPSSWLMDSACCNHMTPHSSLFFELKPAPHPLHIRTANGSTMSGHNIGSVSTSNLSILGVFNAPDLS